MLRPDEVMDVVERLLDQGVDSRERIVEAVALAVDMDEFQLRRLAADKAVSLALAAMRDENGDRVAFPSRNEDGERVIVHVAYTRDAWAMHRAGLHLVKVGQSMVRSGERLQARAVQLGLFDGRGGLMTPAVPLAPARARSSDADALVREIWSYLEPLHRMSPHLPEQLGEWDDEEWAALAKAAEAEAPCAKTRRLVVRRVAERVYAEQHSHEARARQARVEKIRDHIWSGWSIRERLRMSSVHTLEGRTDAEWWQIARDAGIRGYASWTTRKLVADGLRHMVVAAQDAHSCRVTEFPCTNELCRGGTVELLGPVIELGYGMTDRDSETVDCEECFEGVRKCLRCGDFPAAEYERRTKDPVCEACADEQRERDRKAEARAGCSDDAGSAPLPHVRVV